MELLSTIFISLAPSEPVVILIALLRSILCIYRSHQSKHIKFTVFSSLITLLLLMILGAIVVVWFGYGVAHTGKDYSTDLFVLLGTLSLAYISSILAWWASAHMDKSHK